MSTDEKMGFSKEDIESTFLLLGILDEQLRQSIVKKFSDNVSEETPKYQLVLSDHTESVNND